MNRKKIIAGNWKMNKTGAEARELAQALKAKLADVEQVEVVVCPPFTALSQVAEILKDSRIGLGAQNMHWEEAGAYTGEVSAPMLKAVGCRYVILGHSERRQYFGETNSNINRKVKKALDFGLIPILCVGETLTERKAGVTQQVVEEQIRQCLEGIDSQGLKNMVIAYEPVWAIGTGVNATPEQAEEVHRFIRGLLESIYNSEVARNLRIQYGGSVSPSNARELLTQEDVDGALVGGASLKAESFVEIIKTIAS